MGNEISANAHRRECVRLCLLLGPEGKKDLAIARRQLNYFTPDTNFGTIAEEPIQIYQMYDEVVKFFQEIGDPWQTALTFASMGLDLVRSGNFTGVRQALEESLILFQECGDSINASIGNERLARIPFEEGNYAEARAQLERVCIFTDRRALIT